MAKKQKVNKTQAVRDYLKAHPKAMSGEIAAALTKQGITVNAGHVANIKTKINKERPAKKAVKATPVAAVAAVQATVEPEKNGKAGATVTLEQVKAVAVTIKALGGSVCLANKVENTRKRNRPTHAATTPESSSSAWRSLSHA
jgi:hypothetical protein